MGGPFLGLALETNGFESAQLPKVLGTYELELFEVIERIIALSPARIVNIGCADGYYAVGFAKRLPQSTIFAFETSAYGRWLCKKTAKRNGVAARITILGKAMPHLIRELVTENCVIVCDCEGDEVTLLDCHLVPGLKGVPILVETHSYQGSDTEVMLMERFSSSHHIRRIASRMRKVEDFRWPGEFSERETLEALNEHRPGPQSWLWMIPMHSRVRR